MNRILKKLKIIFCISKYLGLNPCTFLNNGILKCSASSFLYSIGLVISVTLIILRRVLFFWSTLEHKTVIYTTFEFQILVSTFTYTVSVTIFLIQCKKFARIVERISIIDYRFGPFFLEKRFYPSCRWPLMLMLGFLSYSCIFAFSYIYSRKIEVIIAYPIFFISYYSPYVMLIQFSCLTQFCCHCFALLNNEISNLIIITVPKKSLRRQRKADTMKSNINTSSSEIFKESSFSQGTKINFLEKSRYLAVIHGKLCDLVKVINSVYSLPILFIIADIFVGVTVEIFNVFYIICLYSTKIIELSILTSVISWYILKLVIVLHTCVTCTSEVSFL
jgi:hypothetical protein